MISLAVVELTLAQCKRMQNREEYGIFVPGTQSEGGFWLRLDEKLASYNLEKRVRCAHE